MIFIYTYVTHVIYSNIPSIDEIMDWNIEEIVASSDQLPSQTDIDTKLASLKPNVLSALIDNSYLNPLHEKLATKAELQTSLNSLYCHHPSNEIHFEIKETMAITISNWYTKYRLSYLESSVNRHLTPFKCKSCGSTTAIFERLSGQFNSIPVLLSIELGHIVMKDFSVSKIDQHFTISHNEQTLYYKLAGFSICTNKHFYSILNNNGQLCKYDGIRNHLTEPWDYDTFVGTINTVFYLLHSSD